MIKKSDWIKMTESATERANASAALRAIGEKCQKIATQLSDVKLKDLPVVIKTLKLNTDNNVSDINQVQQTVSQYLDQMINTCMEASSSIDDLSYEIMGDLSISDENMEKVEDELEIDDEDLDLDDEDEESEEEVEEISNRPLK